ncbi:MAG TPA: hypothetical protein VJ698_13105 [Noviherbaspirillum sp.]|uniref:hypothetical protein n=1 Tax=Noviherbaspirillum sp. TaxID=1926288 RepID=UPI002B48900F|nr:hypothetical protein [Noviherbaspirillum sp.]HJV86406.1 hypothetical protein [Noviherbaspirillum sp.]
MKPSFPKTSSLLLSIGSALLLAACGGGGGSGSSPVSPTALSTITSANAPDVAAQAYAASSAINDTAITGGTAGATIATGVVVQDSPGIGFIDATLQHMYRALAVKPANMVVGVMGTNTVNCTGGGTMTGSYNMMNTNMVSNGDTMTITSNNCMEDMVRINGTITISFSNLAGMPSATSQWSATMRMNFTNFAVTENSITDTANGDISLGFVQDNVGTRSFTMSGNTLQMSTTRSGTTVMRTLSNYDYSASETAAGLYTYRCNYTMSGDMPRLGSNVSYTVQTMTPFRQQGTSYPNQGVMKVTATDNTSLTFTVLDSASVQIAIDRNGDGTIDETMTKTWVELTSLI